MLRLVRRSLDIFHEEGARALIRNIIRFIYRDIVYVMYWPRLLYLLHSSKGNHSIDYLIGFVYDHCRRLLKPTQVREEISALLNYVSRGKITSYIEIGTATGGTLFLMSRLAAPEALLISIDLPGGPFGGGYVWWQIPTFKMFAYAKQKLHLIRDDSHRQETLTKVKQILQGRKVDMLFIDGDHTYEGVKKDFELYSPLVKEGGTIGFHDIAKHAPGSTCEVNKFWNEIKGKYKNTEIIQDQKQQWAGLGIITYQEQV